MASLVTYFVLTIFTCFSYYLGVDTVELPSNVKKLKIWSFKEFMTPTQRFPLTSVHFRLNVRNSIRSKRKVQAWTRWITWSVYILAISCNNTTFTLGEILSSLTSLTDLLQISHKVSLIHMPYKLISLVLLFLIWKKSDYKAFRTFIS